MASRLPPSEIRLESQPLKAEAEEERVSQRRFTPAKLVARNSILNLGSEIWTVAVLIFAMPIVLGKLGKDAFGLFSLAWVVLDYLAILDIGVSRATTKFVSECLAKGDRKSIAELSRTALTVNMLLGVLGGSLVLVSARLLTDKVFSIPIELRRDALIAFYGLAFAVPVLLVQAALRAVLSSYQRFGWISFVNSSAVTAQWGLACLLAARGVRVSVIILAAVLVRTLATLLYAAVLLRTDRQLVSVSTIRLPATRRLLRYGGWVSVSQIIAPVLIYLDRILVASLISIGTMTIYVIPYEIVTRLRVIPGSLVTTLFPSLSERSGIEKDTILPTIYSTALRYLILLVMPCFLAVTLLSRDILSFWVGAEYASRGAVVLQIIGVSALLNALAFVPYAALQALGRPDVPAKLHLVEVPLYVALSFALIPRWGIAGASIAVAIRLSLDAVILFWAAATYVACQIQYEQLWRPLVLNFCFAAAIECCRLLFASPAARLSVLLLLAAIYCLAIWLFVLDQNDKPMLLRALRLSNETAAS